MRRHTPTWRQLWSEFKAGTPGSRFSEQHRRRGQAHGARVRMALMIAGILLLATGALLVFTPGPGFVLVAIGAGMLARESAAAARMLDRLEVRLRGLLREFPGRASRSADRDTARSPRPAHTGRTRSMD